MTQATPGARALRCPAPQAGPDRFLTLDREAFDVIVVEPEPAGMSQWLMRIIKDRRCR